MALLDAVWVLSLRARQLDVRNFAAFAYIHALIVFFFDLIVGAKIVVPGGGEQIGKTSGFADNPTTLIIYLP